MTTAPITLVTGQNMPVDPQVVTVSVTPALALVALLVDADHHARTSAHLLTADQPTATGVRWSPSAVEIDTAAVASTVHAVLCLVTVDPDQAPVASVRDPQGVEIANYTAGNLTTERLVIVVELYRRAGGWRLRAVGQGYTGGLVTAAADYGITLSAPAAPPPALDDARVPQRVRAVWEDAARSTAAYVSACTYAEDRRDAEIALALADPTQRRSPATAAARALASSRHDELVARAEARHDRDIDTLATELAALQLVLPAAVSAWTSPAWESWSPPSRVGSAIRLGTVRTDLAPTLHVPLLAELPLSAALWLDSAGAEPGATARAVVSIVLRLLAAHPAAGMRLRLVDLLGGLADSPVAAVAVASGRLHPELDELTRRVEMVRLTHRAGGGLDDVAARLLVVHGLPHGLEEHSVRQLSALALSGPAAGVFVVFTGDRADLLGHDAPRELAQLAESAQRLAVAGDGTINDPWVGQEWVVAADLGPADDRAARVVRTVAGRG